MLRDGFKKGAGMADFFSFRRMITPRLIQFLFVVGVVLSTLAGLILIAAGIVASLSDDGAVGGLAIVLLGLVALIFGPIIVRVYCEFLILFFRINETLTDVDQKMDQVQAVVDRRGAEIQGAIRSSH